MRSFQTERLLISRIHPSDAIYLLPIWNDERVIHDAPIELVRSLRDAERLIQHFTSLAKRQRSSRYTIFRQDEQRIIGSAGFYTFCKERKCAEIGYELAYDEWGQGFGKEVLDALEQIAIRDFQLSRLYGYVSPHNERSIRLLQRAGYERIGDSTSSRIQYAKRL